MWVKHRDSIVESLITDIDDQLLQESRDILFRSAVDLYDEILDSQGIEGRAYLSMKKRKTTANNAKYCYNLYVFCAGIISIFPRDILSSDSKSIYTTQDQCSQYKGDDKTANELNKVEKKCKCEELENMLIKVVDEIKLLKEQIDLINGNEISVGKRNKEKFEKLFQRLRDIEQSNLKKSTPKCDQDGLVTAANQNNASPKPFGIDIGISKHVNPFHWSQK